MDSIRSNRKHSQIGKDLVHRVLLTTDTIGGVWQYSVELARGLASQDIEVVLATMGRRPSPAQRKAIEAISGATLHESEYKLEWMDDAWADVEKAGSWLLDLESQFQPDIVHLNGYCHASLPWNCPVLVVAHSCVYSWFEAVRKTPPDDQWEHYKQEVIRGLHAADSVVAPTQFMAQAIARHYDYEGPQTVIHNGCMVNGTSKIKKEPFIFSAGRLWDEARNIRTLAEAAAILEWPVYVAGERQHPDGGEVEFPNVHPLGLLDPSAMAYWYGRAQIYALPALYEPFGLPVLEAAQAGCVLVLGDIPGLREIWDDAAIFVNPEDSLSLAHTLNRLMRDPRLRKDYIRRSTRRALQFTSDRMVREYLAIYRDLASGSSNPHSASFAGISAQQR